VPLWLTRRLLFFTCVAFPSNPNLNKQTWQD
jgi:hypothetical protein